MQKFIYFLYTLVHIPFLPSLTLADRLSKAEKGDYLVTEQDKHYCLLLLRENSPRTIILEKITVPAHKIHLPGMDWADWVSLGAPGHSAWIQYEIDRITFKLIECYSHSKKGWLYLDESELFFSTLLSLELNPVSQEERKKIGVAPAREEIDQRPTWNPTLVLNSEKKKLPCDVLKTYWPKDNTALSSCRITLYFPTKEDTKFPIWIEANNGHFSYNAKGIYFGKNLISPLSSTVPKRPLSLTQVNTQSKTHKTLCLLSPSYYKDFSLYVFDLLYPEKVLGPIAFSLEKSSQKERYLLNIKTEDLSVLLQKNHRYKWVIKTKDSVQTKAESDDFFMWNP